MAKDLSYLFSQLRRIEDHREVKAEKAIRKIYKQMLKESQQLIAEEYYNLAEDGKLTFDILRGKGQDARFLSEVEKRFDELSQDVSKEIRKTVEEMYQLSFDGLRNAVKKSKDAEQLKELLDVPSINTAQTMWASVNNTIMDIALEKNHKNNIWNIKREVATALTVGDRYDTMANRLAKTLNGNYKKANLIARTEMGRVREAGHLAAAKDINESIKKGSSGLQMVKKWKSMKDGKVRDPHREMHDVVVEMDEPFELPDGVETQAPKQSGVARQDCNCRCTCLYLLMDDEMFFKATGKHFKNNSENGVENPSKNDKIRMNREATNTGAFAELPERMSKKHIRDIAKEYSIDLKGITLRIDSNEDLLAVPLTGCVDPEHIGQIIFLPNAFGSREELLRTLFHEKVHVGQFREFGVDYVQANRAHFEELAYSAENAFIEKLRKEGRI